MADKILRITFNGVCTLTPAAPQNGEERKRPNAFVLMPANRQKRKNDWAADIEPHFPFVYVPVSVLSGWVPPPAEAVDDEKLGKCNVYFINDARVVLDPPPIAGVEYYVDPEGRKLKERPGSADVAPEHDIRWLMNIGEIDPQAQLSVNPTARDLGPEVEVVVELAGGTLKANFPCKTVQAKTFADRNNGPVPGFKRVLATEFFIEMHYPENTPTVTLALKPLRSDPKSPPSGIGEHLLILQWGDRSVIDLRMGNDTRSEVRQLQSFKRCDARTRDSNGRPVAVPRDDDFELHYGIVKLSGTSRPLPQNGPHQTQFDGCSPASVRQGGT